MNRVVILLSGGLDSSTAVALARHSECEVNAITFDYGQKHWLEIEAAKRVATALNCARHLIVPADLSFCTTSALTGTIAVPKGDVNERHIPVTYVPARNMIFLSYAIAWAEVLEISTVIIGANVVDYSGYPDCRPEFLRAMQETAIKGTRSGIENRPIKIEAPFLVWSKAEIIQCGIKCDFDYSLTSSCYDVTDQGACGQCEACYWRLRGFKQLGIPDPIVYR
jgi:7-cyano-7-deazaguanine synthase